MIESITNLHGIQLPQRYLVGVHAVNMAGAAEQLARIEWHVAKPLAKHYLHRYPANHKTANIWLRRMVDACAAAQSRFPVPVIDLRNDVRRELVAAEWARRCQQLLARAGNECTAAELLADIGAQAKAWHFCPTLPIHPRTKVERLLERPLSQEERDDLADEVDKFEGAAASLLVRLLDESWWLRKINRAWAIYCELIAILTGQVRKGVSPYASAHAVREFTQRKAAQQAWMAGMSAVNEELGQEIDLADAIMASVANPEIRRHELMVRMRGFEDMAQEQGKLGLFLTLTAPSSYHAWRQGSKDKSKTYQNDDFNGSTPTDTNRLLCKQWARFRAALAREGIMAFGFRVVEPHHDGTPHWHCLLFINPEHQRDFLTLLAYHFTATNRAELKMPNGAQLDALAELPIRNKFPRIKWLLNVEDPAVVKAINPRVNWKVIDPTKGSATGYIAKYIAKNIDGHKVGMDYEAEAPVDHTTIAVAAWASCWRIRQFQQIGGPAVSVWRELRRLGDEVIEWDCILEAARTAADNNRWGDFIGAMGGIDLPRKEHLIRLSKRLDEAANKYGEDVLKLMGVITDIGMTTAVTRTEGWQIVRKGVTGSGLGEQREPAVGERSELQSGGGSRHPRSSVNNCTKGSKSGVKGSALAKELGRMGLDESNAALLLHGSIIHADGQYVRLVGDRLIVTRNWPGAGDAVADQLTAEVEAEQASNRAASSDTLKQQASELMHSGGNITEWLAALPLAKAEEAIAIFTRLLDDEEDRASYQPTEQEQARVASMQADNDRHQAEIAKARARLGVE
ncbi:replication endonuclease [Aeromonas dhakensis]|uniref:replication endonuclease n=1 Tax=Aeromonas dhakensis TaxID=196024 RepID=UPI001116A22A|nr:replication endonuclease [Aeromonas dhakensis]TNI33169.1 replication initiation protein [Aeromonas dhakensis]TNI49047.1 replication initiation protein [Aeromonas dhakensis]